VDIFPHLQSLLAAIRHTEISRSATAPTGSASGTTGRYEVPVSSDELLTVLSSIQNRVGHLGGPVERNTHSDIRSSIYSALNRMRTDKNLQPRLNQVDEDLINLVSMLFEFILNDYNLAPSIQVLISRLQIPVLKVVLQDRSFFNSNRHPARQLLNSMAKAGIGWTEPQDPMKDTLYNKIHRIVHRVLADFDGDVSLFETLNTEFREFIEREDKKARIVEQRTKESETGRIRANQAQKSVDTVINQLIERHPGELPEVIENTLRHGWARVMFLAHLKDDQEHRWNKTVAIAEDLAWCATPPTSVKDRQKWIAVVPRLLKDLKSGLKEVSYNTATLDDTLNEIKTTLTSSFRDAALAESDRELELSGRAPAPKRPTQGGPIEETAVQRQMASRDSELERHLDLVNSIEPGTWVEFTLSTGNHFRCKLSTRIDEADCLIFVNRMGLKTREKNKLELAEELRKKQARILEQGPMIDRAMQALMSNLRQKAQTSQ
jgi:hypothetical protein